MNELMSMPFPNFVAVLISILIFSIVLIFKKPISDRIKGLTKISHGKGKSKTKAEFNQSNSTGTKEVVQGYSSTKTVESDESINIENEQNKGDRDWLSDVITKFNKKEPNKAEDIFNKYLKNEKDSAKRDNAKLIYLYHKFNYEKDNSVINEIEELIRTTTLDDNFKFRAFLELSFCYNISMQNEKRVNLWRTAITKIKDHELLTSATIQLSGALNKEDKSLEARQLLIDRLSKVNQEKEKSDLYYGLSRIESSLGHDSIAIYCKNKSLEYDPTNKDKLFRSAYEASNKDIDEVSISNYVKLINIDGNNSMALNNLGVVVKESGLEIQAINNYKKASNHNNTLAMSNQGYMLLNAGFADEAEKIANEAISLDDTHENVHNLIVKIKNERTKQQEEWNKITKKALKQQKVMQEYIEQYYLGDSNSLEGDWLVNDSTSVNLTIHDDSFKISWSKKDGTHIIELNGKVSGSTFNGVYEEENKNDTSYVVSILSSLPKSIPCIGYLSENKNSINVVSTNLKEDFSLRLFKGTNLKQES